MKILGIIADNLTGANDTGVKFSKHGISSVVVLKMEHLAQLTKTAKVISVNTATRYLEADQAAHKVRETTKQLKKIGVSHFYKKLDSTLRGNPGVEFQVIMDELDMELGIIVPSFPDNGRIVENGYLFINGNDGQNNSYPVCFVPSLFEKEAGDQVLLISLSSVRQGSDHLKSMLHEIKGNGQKKVVVDAVTDDDLEIIAEAIKDLGMKVLLAGSAGMASHLPFVLDLLEDNNMSVRKDRAVLVIMASFNQVTARQINYLKRSNQLNLVEFSTERFSEGDRRKVLMETFQVARKELIANNIVVIATDTLLKDREDLQGYKISQHVAQYGVELAEGLGDVAKKLILEGLVTDLVVTGGGTAYHVTSAMGADGIVLEHELLPGIPIGKILGGQCEGIRIVTKAGGFGHVDALDKVVKFIKGNNCALLDGYIADG